MCANYEVPVQLELAFDVLPVTFETRSEVYPCDMAPILLADREAGDTMISLRGLFGIVPHWAKDTKIARSTYNARSETVAKKNSFRSAWARRQTCLVPAASIFEFNYESGKPERWKIRRKDQRPFAIAALFETCKAKNPADDPRDLRSFSMLTINADDHPLMSRFHPPDDEKRSIVVVDPSRYMEWLLAEDEEQMRSMLTLMPPDDYEAFPAPRPPRATLSQ